MIRKSKKPVYTYDAKLVEVIDGDTYKLMVDLGFSIHHVVHVRIRGINTAEIYGAEAEEGFMVADYVRDMFLKAKKIVVETQYIKTFARFEADVFLDGMDLAEHLLTEGFADLS